MNNDVILTPSGQLSIYGHPLFQNESGDTTRVLFKDANDGLELFCLPCLSDLLHCTSGLTLQIDVTYDDISCLTLPNYVIDSVEDFKRDMGLEIKYENRHFFAQLQMDHEQWKINVPYTVKSGITYRLLLSWKNSERFVLFINGYTEGEPEKIRLNFFNYVQPRPAMIGRSRTDPSSCSKTIANVFLWTAYIAELQDQGVIGGTTSTPFYFPSITLRVLVDSIISPECNNNK